MTLGKSNSQVVEVAQIVRKALRDEMRQVEDPFAISLSSGLDSNSLALAAQLVGRRFSSMSFSFKNHWARDFQWAKHNAKIYKVQFIGVRLPTDEEVIVDDVVWLIEEIGCRTKTEIECCWPFIYQMKVAASRGFTSLVCGWGADDFYGLEMGAAMKFPDQPEEFRKYRDHRWAGPLPAQLKCVHRMAKHFRIKFVLPYTTNQELHDALFRLDWKQLHLPRQKEPIRLAFPEHKKLSTRYHTNLQLGDSEIAKRMGQAMLNSKYNRGWSSAKGVYGEIIRRMT